ncbi:hypothetical protein HERIO_323 [Hepatospora eriocheir]|uniref:Uncharacterized protein n=1 Tax=Hepatospora eriocheir TaxID=1081669 RepID=A0A1X0QDH8_9MICR|nr:hypothetical protein HERIO_323 [Hepatospora eriocheir]
MFLTYIGRKINYSDIADLFGISRSKAFYDIHFMVKFILKVKNDYIKLPNSDEFKILSEKFLTIKTKKYCFR